MKRTKVDQVFAALPGPEDEAVSVDALQARLPEFSRQDFFTPLHALKVEGSIEYIRRRGAPNVFRRLGEARTRREYVLNSGVAHREPEGPRNAAVAEALTAAQAKYGALELHAHVDAAEPVEHAARAVTEFSRAATELEARMHRLLQHNQRLEAELERYRQAFHELAAHLHKFEDKTDPQSKE